MSLDALNDIKAFESLKKKERAALAEDVKEALGADWKVDEEQKLEAALSLVHKPTKLPFVLVPGGTFEMGLTEDDLIGLKKVTKWDDAKIQECAEMLQHLTPAHEVKVSPFVTMVKTMTHKEVEKLSKKKFTGIFCYELARDDAQSLIDLLGFRFPSNAEYEWMARDGRQLPFTLDVGPRLKAIRGDSTKLKSQFGVTGMFSKQWLSDDNHSSYEGAPAESGAWVDGDPKGMTRGGTDPEAVEDSDELPALLACSRTEKPAMKAGIRLARSFPSS